MIVLIVVSTNFSNFQVAPKFRTSCQRIKMKLGLDPQHQSRSSFRLAQTHQVTDACLDLPFVAYRQIEGILESGAIYQL